MDDTKELTDLLMVFPRKMNLLGRTLINRFLKDTRLRTYHLMILKGVSNADGISQKDLVGSIPFDKSYISTGVRDLIEWGYVRNDSDGKTYSLSITDSGRDIVGMSDMLFDIMEQNIMNTLSEEEREILSSTMRKLNMYADQVLEQYSDKGRGSS